MKYLITLLAVMTVGFANVHGQTPFSEDFESVTVPGLPSGWTQDKSSSTSKGWQTRTGSVSFPNTQWTMPAHTTYVAVDDWNNPKDHNNPAKLITPKMDLTGVTNPFIHFQSYFIGAQYKSGNQPKETFTLQVSTDGISWTNLNGTVKTNSSKWEDNYFDLTAYKNSTTVQVAFVYSDADTQLFCAAIDDIKIVDPPSKEIALTKVTPLAGHPTAFNIANGSIPLGGEIKNSGASTVTAVTLKYQEGTAPATSVNVTGLNIPPYTTATFTSPTPYTAPSAVGPHKLKVWIEYPGDTDPTNDSGTTTFTTVSQMPKKKILAEEATGTWCGYCPRGHVYMDSIANNSYNSSFSLVAVHNQDPMTVASYNSKIGSMIGGFPSMVIDRREVFDPSEIITVYNNEKDYFGFADISLTNMPADGFKYSVKATVKPATDLSGDYRLALAITEDRVHGDSTFADSARWNQHNYYSFQVYNIPLQGAGIDWQNEPNPVSYKKMYYDHVARAIYPTPDGAVGSLPATMTAGSTYDYTFDVTLKPYWHRYFDYMKAVVMLIRTSDGVVLNSENITIPLGVSDVTAGIEGFKVFPNPANNKAFVNFSLAEQSTVNVIVTDMVGHVVKQVSTNSFNTGKHRVELDMSNISSGIYNVTLQTETGKTSTRLSVVK